MNTKVNIKVISEFIQQQSNAEQNRFVFSYTISIENASDLAFQLVSRRWLISDANSKTEEVCGEGVVGEQPIIQPGEIFTYSSGCVLETEMGTMEGCYFMLSEKAGEFEVTIPKFLLSVPRTIH